MSKIVIGILGGSGLYEIQGLKNIRSKKISTPFGAPSDAYTLGTLNGVTLVFLPRHGKGHRLNPSEINYRANIYGMKMLGVEYLLSMSAVGSMKEEIPPRDVVIVDQFIDRTKGIRPATFFEKGLVAHLGFSEPVCSNLAQVAYAATKKITPKVHPKGTYVCIEGPQFSTRAESHLYRSWNVDVIGMTNLPEAKLAREAEICYATLAFSTDYDCWKEDEEAVTAHNVLEVIQSNVETAKKIIQEVAKNIPKTRKCTCKDALKYAFVTEFAKVSKQTKNKLKHIIGRYV